MDIWRVLPAAGTPIRLKALETFTNLTAMVANPRFAEQRRTTLDHLDFGAIDAPMVAIIRQFAKRPFCFTLQSCFGHFLYESQNDIHDTAPLPVGVAIGQVDYRLAYLALCIEDSKPGRRLFARLKSCTRIDPDFVQFGCAEWFWQHQINSYALQIAPKRHICKDRMLLGENEARHVEKIRNRVYHRLKELLGIES